MRWVAATLALTVTASGPSLSSVHRALNPPNEMSNYSHADDEPPAALSQQLARKFEVVDTRCRGVATGPGIKHGEDPALNEDTALVAEYVVDRRLIRLALVLDGHGPRKLESCPSPGRLAAVYGISALRVALEALLPDVVKAPLLPPTAERFSCGSRQAVIAKAFNRAQVALRSALPAVSRSSGATAAAMLFVSDAGTSVTSGGTLLATNMGDSLSFAFTFRRKNGNETWALDAAFLMAKEENIRMLSEQEEFVRRAKRAGYRPAAIGPPPFVRGKRRKYCNVFLVFVPESTELFDISSYEPFRSLRDLRLAVEAAAQVVPKDKEYAVFAMLRSTYVTKLSTLRNGKAESLQLTATLGDFAFTPVKKSSRVASDVVVVRLKPQRDTLTLTLTASDGLWGAMAAQQREDAEIGFIILKWLQNNLFIADDSLNLNQLSKYLVNYARDYSSDDITAAVMSFPGMGVVWEPKDVFASPSGGDLAPFVLPPDPPIPLPTHGNIPTIGKNEARIIRRLQQGLLPAEFLGDF